MTRRTSLCLQLLGRSILVLFFLNGSTYCNAFQIQPPPHIIAHSTRTTIPHHTTITTTTTTTTELNAKKNKKRAATRNTKRNRTKSSSGFGGAAVEPCPCGSDLGYMKCCGILHKDAKAYGNATAEAVVRARYSAYAKREVDFIIGSTHPLNKDFMTDIEHWKETIRTNCYDNFELKNCQILQESYEKENEEQNDNDPNQKIATVQFIATMTQIDSREKTSFMETSTFERAGQHIREGAWLYKSGDVEPVEVVNVDEDGENVIVKDNEDGDGVVVELKTNEDEEASTTTTTTTTTDAADAVSVTTASK